jgi:hypothetical protein
MRCKRARRTAGHWGIPFVGIMAGLVLGMELRAIPVASQSFAQATNTDDNPGSVIATGTNPG